MPFRLLSESETATLPGGVANLRGWEVRDDAGELVGGVRDAVLDDAGDVRYLDVQLAGVTGARRVLLPIGFARLKPPTGMVELPGVRRADLDALLDSLPEYTGDLTMVTTEYERRLGPAWSRDLTDQDSYGAVRSTDPDVPSAPHRPEAGSSGPGVA
ncbi:MAG: PRC-barrel domain-containing protein [Chloroflexota bacterium]|nr:PRC-barrel domain-containing protein [Chloroflexota bacterium]